MLEPGDAAPDFTLRDQNREPVTLSAGAGSKRLLVFIPLPFTRTCESELCAIRDNFDALASRDAEVMVITCDTTASNKKWAEEQNIDFPILSDFWPHGDVSKAFGCFNEKIGVPDRATFTIDETGIIRDVVTSESFGQARDFAAYTKSLDVLSS